MAERSMNTTNLNTKIEEVCDIEPRKVMGLGKEEEARRRKLYKKAAKKTSPEKVIKKKKASTKKAKKQASTKKAKKSVAKKKASTKKLSGAKPKKKVVKKIKSEPLVTKHFEEPEIEETLEQSLEECLKILDTFESGEVQEKDTIQTTKTISKSKREDDKFFIAAPFVKMDLDIQQNELDKVELEGAISEEIKVFYVGRGSLLFEETENLIKQAWPSLKINIRNIQTGTVYARVFDKVLAKIFKSRKFYLLKTVNYVVRRDTGKEVEVCILDHSLQLNKQAYYILMEVERFPEDKFRIDNLIYIDTRIIHI